MAGRRLACGLALAAAVATVSAPPSGTARPIARAAACDPLGVAGSFGILAHANVTVPNSGGTSIHGRIAAGGDVTISGGVFVGPATGDATPTVIAGRDFVAGKDTSNGGTVDGGVLYGRKAVVGAFTVNGGLNQGNPPFDFDDEFRSLALLSDTWAKETQTPGAQVTLAYGALTFTGTATGLNVFNIDASLLAGATNGIVINLPAGSPSALINVSGAVPVTASPQYMNLSGGAGARRLIWNLPQVTGLTVTHGVAWKGLILAPNASITGQNRPQLDGQIIARDVPGGEWVISKGELSTCPPGPTPAPEPDASLVLEALCVDPFGNLAMRVANVGTGDRTVHWDDLGTGKTDLGDFAPQHGRYQYFNVRDGDAASRIRMVADSVTFAAVPGTGQRCGGRITITKQTVGDAPPGPWTVELTGVDSDGVGVKTRRAQLGAGVPVVFDALGGYQPGSAAFGKVVGGISYTISEPDPLGGIAEISANPVQILGFSDPEHAQNEPVTVTNPYPEPGGGGEPVPPIEPGQPTLPPGAPDPPPGPVLDGGHPGAPNADLVVTHSIRPAQVRVGGTVLTLTRVRNAGPRAATGVVLRELPQYRALEASRVARIVSVSASAGRCTSARPVRCELGTLRSGAEVTVRSRARLLVAAALQSVVLASSQTPESNTTNNTGVAPVLVHERAPHLRVGISAPPSGRVGVGLRYRVHVTGTREHGARFVRLCAPGAATLTEVHAHGTFAHRGGRCRDIRELPSGRTVSFEVSAVPAA